MEPARSNFPLHHTAPTVSEPKKTRKQWPTAIGLSIIAFWTKQSSLRNTLQDPDWEPHFKRLKHYSTFQLTCHYISKQIVHKRRGEPDSLVHNQAGWNHLGKQAKITKIVITLHIGLPMTWQESPITHTNIIILPTTTSNCLIDNWSEGFWHNDDNGYVIDNRKVRGFDITITMVRSTFD